MEDNGAGEKENPPGIVPEGESYLDGKICQLSRLVMYVLLVYDVLTNRKEVNNF